MTDHEQLIEDYLNGDLSDADAIRLRAWLSTDADHLQQFIRRTHQHGILHAELHGAEELERFAEGQQATMASPCVQEHRSTLTRVYCFFAQPTPLSLTVAGAVIGFLVISMAFMAPPFFRAVTKLDEGPAPDPYRIVAEVTALHEVEWVEANDGLHRGAFLVPGRQLQLSHGVIEVTYRNGAIVALEGPCDFVVEDLAGGQLKRGRLLAHVPEAAVGFRVTTPTASITDLGTEFGVVVHENGAADVIVSAGKVACVGTDDAKSPGKPLILSQGQGVSIRAVGVIAKQSDADARLFAELRSHLETARRTRGARRIVGVSIHDVSSELTQQEFDRGAAHLVDGSGLSGRFHSAVPDGSMWETRGSFTEPHNALPAEVTFDLGDRYELSHIHVWNYNEVTRGLHNVGAREVEIAVSPTDDPADLVPLSTFAGNFEFPQADGMPTYRGFAVPFDRAANTAALVQARLVRFTILSNHGGAQELTGLSEVQFWGRKLEEP